MFARARPHGGPLHLRIELNGSGTRSAQTALARKSNSILQLRRAQRSEMKFPGPQIPRRVIRTGTQRSASYGSI